MAHYVEIEDARGDLREAVPACSASCAREVARVFGIEYRGWNGAYEGGDAPEYCAGCGVRCVVGLGETECWADCLYPWTALLTPPWTAGRWEQVPGACPHGIAYAYPVEDVRRAYGAPAAVPA